MQPITRRSALTLGGLGLAGTALGGAGLTRPWTWGRLDVSTGGRLVEPEALRSADGRLDVRLVAAEGTHEVAGRPATTLGYNGGLPGPTLRVRPGDTLAIELENRLDQPTNLHVHGLHVSPRGNGDNVFVSVAPGESFGYEHRIPEDHPPGLYWYHPHHHGNVADQVFGGLYGAIVVEEPEPQQVARERVLVVSDITLDESGRIVVPSTMEQMMGREGDQLLVNGRAAPVARARPGERERWRLVNACTSRHLSLRLERHDATVVGRDLGALPRPGSLEDLVLAPGNRADLLVTVREGEGGLTAVPYDRGGMTSGSMMRDEQPATLVTLRGSGAPSGRPAPSAAAPTRVRDLRTQEVAGRRLLTFETGMMGGGMMSGDGGMNFTIDGRAFDADRVDQRVEPGTVEEWTIRNDSPMAHPFHLHVWPMQVVDAPGIRVTDPLWLDVVDVPGHGQVTVRVAFDDFDGPTVYHCHILDHEDRGMMGIVQTGEAT